MDEKKPSKGDTPDSGSLDDVYVKEYDGDHKDPDATSEEGDEEIIKAAQDVAVLVISTDDDPSLPVFTFRTIFLGVGLSAFASVLGTIYTFKPQNATVSQLFVLIIAYILGKAMEELLPRRGWFRYLNPGPFNIKGNSCIVIMSSTASNVSTAMEIIAALNLFYDIKLNGAVAMFQIFSTQMIGYGIAGLLRTLLVYPTYAFYPSNISVVNLLQSLHWGGLLNHKKRRYFWIVFCAIFFWEWIPQYPFPLLTAISIICLADNGRHTFVRNLFGAGSSNEGIGLFSFSTSWTLITQGNPLIWPLQTRWNFNDGVVGMALGYIILTSAYYGNVFNGRNLPFMSTDLFASDGSAYNQSLILTPQNTLDPAKLAVYGAPRYTTTYAISQLAYNLSLGAAIVHVLIWNWRELREAFGGMKWLRRGVDQDIQDPHFEKMKVYKEVPQWWYISLLFGALAVAIGCNYGNGSGHPLMPWWSALLFTALSAFFAIFLGFITATTGFSITVKGAIQIIAAFIHAGNPITVMYANLFGNSTSFQTLYMLQDLKLGQYNKIPPRLTFASQMLGSIIGSIFNYTMMISIVDNNRAVLQDPIGTRVWSGWIIQQYNSNSVAMGALVKELFVFGKPYWLVPFSIFLGLFMPLPFFLLHKYVFKGEQTKWGRLMRYMNTPIVLLYIGWLPFSVNGMWWSCLVIGVTSQWWARTRRPGWFKKYNYLTSAALDGGSQVILFILSFAVFGASGKAVDFPNWWGNSATLSVDRCAST
ncbi:OPT superfamily oligopeptide transporter [Sistotremastrum suecicum HHB10207 ss-3]|uniref:OPT superfamily oligopeptide transporter n=1 Tax=Sistotremastrum suecicum HHB10207 ss-3 TaxID=1314776 RepID=A0A165YTP6_9AGAM|nr:OPT superfamily oligopeptide transporter [Sistotremastrum suecicum HHB10207 ss-3]